MIFFLFLHWKSAISFNTKNFPIRYYCVYVTFAHDTGQDSQSVYHHFGNDDLFLGWEIKKKKFTWLPSKNERMKEKDDNKGKQTNEKKKNMMIKNK